MPSKTLELVAAPESTPPDFDHVTLLNEVIQKRQQEATDLKMQLENLRARITSERVQWSGQKADEELAIRVRVQELEEAYAVKTRQVDEDIRLASIALANQRVLEIAAEQKVIEAQQRLTELDVLAQERVEVQLLKKQVKDGARGLEERWAETQAMQSKGQDSLKLAQRMSDETQQRTLVLNEREAAVKAREDAVLLREHQMEKVEAVLNQRLTIGGNADGSGGASQEDRGGVAVVAGGIEQGPEAHDAGQGAPDAEGRGE